MEASPLAPLLRKSVETGDFAPIGDLLGDAVLDSSSERGRVRRGERREAMLEHLQAPGPGEVLHWDAREWPTGVAVTFEWRGAGGVDRRRWYVRRDGDRITGWWSYAAAPATAAVQAATLPADLLDGSARPPRRSSTRGNRARRSSG